MMVPPVMMYIKRTFSTDFTTSVHLHH